MPLPGHPIRCPYPVDLTDADCYPKGTLQFSLDTTGSYLRVVGTQLDHPHAYWLRQFVGMAVAIIQEHQRRFVFITRQLTQAVGGGARNVQPALAHCGLPRVACEHVLQQVQSSRAWRRGLSSHASVLFQAIGQSSGPHCTIKSYPSLDAQR